MNALRQLAEKLIHGMPLSGDDVIALLLCLAMVASTSHLITMLVTRWGDRNIALKSLLGSMLIHSVCFLSLEVFDPQLVRQADNLQERPPEPEYDVQVLVESDQTLLLSQSGNTAMVDRPVRPEIDLMRMETAVPDALPEVLPDRPEMESTPAPIAPESVTQFEEQDMTEIAAARYAGEEGAQQAAVEDPAADLKTMTETSPEQVAAPERLTSESAANSFAEPDLTAVMPLPDRGTREFSPDVVPEDISLNAAVVPDSTISLPPVAMDDANMVDRRESPVISPDAGDVIGLAPIPQPQPGAAAAIRTQIPRLAQSRADQTPAPEMVRPSFSRAQTPVPLESAYDDVRIGSVIPQSTDSLATGAPVAMEIPLPQLRRTETPTQAYQLRNAQKRHEAVTRFGGTQESEDAVERSLRWLADAQASDGHWDAEEYGAGQIQYDEFNVNRDFAGRDADTGLTALVVLAFLGAGHTQDAGNYTIEVDRALDWLIQQQQPDGNLFGDARHYAQMYCHGMATYALAEAYGMEKDSAYGPVLSPDLLSGASVTASIAGGVGLVPLTGQPLLAFPADLEIHQLQAFNLAHRLRRVDETRLRLALEKAVTFTLGRQDVKSGGWRYRSPQEGDVSMFGWQMMSLKSAEIAGVEIDPRIKRRMADFLNSVRQGESGGLFGYRRQYRNAAGQNMEPVTPVMTAEALFCQQMLGYPHETASSQESVAYLMQHLPRLAELNYYYWYYGTLAMYQYGGQPWERWNAIVRDTLIAQQRTDGPLTGSWDPNDPWGRYGGRLYSTALATLTLEVYYRLLPLYRMNEVTP
ncbi:MAG: hypothetical protein KDA85_15265 [Planctomycetaceae bacterium]|nr:hypothetical protein [Planctomycetaceae bacterium]